MQQTPPLINHDCGDKGVLALHTMVATTEDVLTGAMTERPLTSWCTWAQPLGHLKKYSSQWRTQTPKATATKDLNMGKLPCWGLRGQRAGWRSDAQSCNCRAETKQTDVLDDEVQSWLMSTRVCVNLVVHFGVP